jgi:hypothetical protein
MKYYLNLARLNFSTEIKFNPFRVAGLCYSLSVGYTHGYSN